MSSSNKTELAGYIQAGQSNKKNAANDFKSRLIESKTDMPANENSDESKDIETKKDNKDEEDWKKLSMKERRLNFKRLLGLSFKQKWLIIGGMIATLFSVVCSIQIPHQHQYFIFAFCS